MKNGKIVPDAFGDALSLADKSAGGLHTLGAVVPVNHTTEVIVRAIMSAAIKANDEYQSAKAARLAATQAQAASDQKSRKLILIARDVLKPVLGSRYSQAWNQAGFVTPTLAMPSRIGQRLARVKLMEMYFGAHPDHGVESLGVTQAAAGALHDEFDGNINALGAAKTAQREKKAEYESAFAALRAELQKLYRELKAVLAKDDPRWIEFGFRVPADIHVPNAPEGLTLTMNAAGHLIATWADTANADRFRVFKRLNGTDYVPFNLTTDTSFDLGTFASGVRVEVQVKAINAAGASVASETAEIVIP